MKRFIQNVKNAVIHKLGGCTYREFFDEKATHFIANEKRIITLQAIASLPYEQAQQCKNNNKLYNDIIKKQLKDICDDIYRNHYYESSITDATDLPSTITTRIYIAKD